MSKILRQTGILLVMMICGALHAGAQNIMLYPASKIGLCPRDTLHLNFDASGGFGAGNIFTAELSNATGSFAAPVPMGTLAGTTSGTIIATIPVTSIAGSAYRIRISASTTATTSPDNGQIFTIKQSPKGIGIAASSPICLTDTLVVTGSSTPRPDSMLWRFPNAKTGKGQVIRLWRESDLAGMTGNVRLIVYLNGCADTAYKSVTLLPHPDTAIITQNGPVCEGDTLRLNATPDANTYTYQWSKDGTIFSTEQNPVIPHTDTNMNGTVVLRIKGGNGCPSFPSTQEISVIKRPAKPEAVSNSPICEGEYLNLDATVIAGARYTWYGPFGVYANFRNPNIPNLPPSATGFYTVIDSVGNCWNSDTIYVQVKAFPLKPTITASSPLCVGDTMYLTTVKQPEKYANKWTLPPGAGNISGSSPDTLQVNKLSIDASGVYILQVANGACVSTDTANITINPLPEVPVASSNSPVNDGSQLQLTGSCATPGVNYAWVGPNNFSSGEQNPVVGLAEKYNEGTYTLVVEKNGCTSSAITMVTINHVRTQNNLSLYPSPNNGNFTISSKLEIEQLAPLKIFNSAGQVVYSAELQSSNKEITQPLNLRDMLPTGIYYLRIKLDGKMHKVPFTIVR